MPGIDGFEVIRRRAAERMPAAVRDIDWIEAADNYARIWTAGRSYLLREPLRVLEKRVGPQGFLRAHRKALVRVAGVRRLAVSDAGDMVAVLDCRVAPPALIVPRRRAVAVWLRLTPRRRNSSAARRVRSRLRRCHQP